MQSYRYSQWLVSTFRSNDRIASRDLSPTRRKRNSRYFADLQGGAKNGATYLSHCKYSENSMTELRGNW